MKSKYTKDIVPSTQKVKAPLTKEDEPRVFSHINKTSTTDASVNTENQDLPVAKAILEMSKSLVEACDMSKNTLSAFLRRLDHLDRERKPPANPEIDNSNMRRTLVIPKRLRSDTQVQSPARKKKKISRYSVVHDNKKK